MLEWLIECAAWSFALAPFAFFWAGCACCTSSCTIFTDDFSTDRTGTDYTTVSGSWSVGSGVLMTSSASAILLANTGYGAGATGVHVTASVALASTSDVGRVVFGYVDANTYWYAEVQAGASNGTLKLYEVSSGTPTQRGSTQVVSGYMAGTAKSVCASIGSGSVRVSIGATAFTSYDATPTTASTKAGLATGAVSSQVTFDDLSVNYHYNDNPSCPSSFCSACSGCATDAPATISVSFTGFADSGGCSCSSLNTTFVISSRQGSVIPGCGGSMSCPTDLDLYRLSVPADCTDFVGETEIDWYISTGGTITLTLMLCIHLKPCGASYSDYAHYYFFTASLGSSPQNCAGYGTVSCTLITSGSTCSSRPLRCDPSGMTCQVAL